MLMKDLRAAVLKRLYELYETKGANVWITEGLDEELGVKRGDSGMIIRDLAERGLVERAKHGGARLTARGVEAIEEPGTTENQLVNSVPNIQNVNISGGNVQLGNHNQQTITYQTVLSQLAEQIESSPSIPEPEKRRWLETFKEIGRHPLTQTILAAAAGVGAAALGK